MKKNNDKVYGIIGTGRFGLAVAKELLARGKNVIAADKNEIRLKSLFNTDAEVFVLEEISKESLIDAGFHEADVIVIGIGKDVEGSILATLNALELGVEKVICKVISDDHAKIIKKLGADVVFPETEIGRKTAIKISTRLAEDILPLSEEFSIIQIETPSELEGKSLRELKMRENYGVSLIATVQNGNANGSVGPDTILKKDEIMVLCGTNKALEKFQQSL